jgi:DNA polymerase I-like protein with 3'-5' exonuclease and polymerase domains
VEISADEAKLFRIAWYGAYPELAFWHDVTRKAKRGGSWLVRTLSNRPIVAKTLTGAYNYACQGSCVDICARAFRLFESAPANISRYVVGFKFDEFMFEVPEFTVLKMRPIIEECMIQAAHGFLWPFGIPAGDVGFSLQKEAKDD